MVACAALEPLITDISVVTGELDARSAAAVLESLRKVTSTLEDFVADSGARRAVRRGGEPGC